MANTYEAIATANGTGSSGTITFSSIPSTYTDLVVVCYGLSSTSNANVTTQFNGDTGTNYSYTILWGNGTSALSVRYTNKTFIQDFGQDTGMGATNGIFSPIIINVMNYANTTTYKTALISSSGVNDASAGELSRYVGLWRSTAAINSLTVKCSSNFTTTSTFSLYGIKAA